MHRSRRCMVLNDSQKFQLIRSVRENECLWNPKNELYHKSKMLQHRWEQTSLKVLGSPRYSDLMKEQWHSLRTYFMCLRRKIRERISRLGGVVAEEEPKWQFFQDMSFLLDPRVIQGDKDVFYPSDSHLMSTSDDVSNTNSPASPVLSSTFDSPPTPMANGNYESPASPVEDGNYESPTSPLENYEVHIQEKENNGDISIINHPGHIASLTKGRAATIKMEKDVEPSTSYKNKPTPNGNCSSDSFSNISEALQNPSPLTPDDLFCIILSAHLKALPESYDKEILKLELMQRVVSHRYHMDDSP